MGIIEAFAVPHPPIIVAGVGRGEEHGAEATLVAYQQVAARIAELAPELLVISSSHGPLYRDAFSITTGSQAWGDFKDFRYSGERIKIDFDEEYVAALIAAAEGAGLPVVAEPVAKGRLDHGCLVPLHFIQPQLPAGCRFARLSISFLSEADHYRLGQCVAQVAEALGRRAVYVASGDMSHRLKESGPYGFDPDGPAFDAAVSAAFAEGDMDGLMHFSKRFRSDAAECGLGSFIIMAGALGALERPLAQAQLLSYEGPWGVGYGIARFVPGGGTSSEKPAAQDGSGGGAGSAGDPAAGTGPAAGTEPADSTARDNPAENRHSLAVRLAYAALNDHFAGRRPSADTPEVAALLQTLPATDAKMLGYLQDSRAGAFVSFKKSGELRGCIGTIEATTESILAEICQNTVSAAAHDPRFSEIESTELPLLTCSVDILGAAEPIDSLEQLDVKRYGVIVSRRGRRGLLLPDLEGVDTPQQQVSIALSKAGIGLREDYRMQRFEVVRYE